MINAAACSHAITLRLTGCQDWYPTINVGQVYSLSQQLIPVTPVTTPALASTSNSSYIYGIGVVAIILIVFAAFKIMASFQETKSSQKSKEKQDLNQLSDKHEPDRVLDDSTKLYINTSEKVPLRADNNYITPGTLLKGKYKIVKLIKSGGMGFVYEGEYDGHKCIIKEAKPGVGINESKYFSEKIKIEAEILGKIYHDNIVRYIDSFEERNSFFLVEEYVEGDKAGDKYLNNPGSEAEVISYTLQLLSAVQYLHKKQIKHRDINPNNIILTPDKKLILIDFGTAKYLNIGRKQTQSVPKSTIVGTPYYAPPEQWEGDASEVSDIFSIGRTMYFMLIGENPTTNPYRRLDFLGKNVTKVLTDFIIKAAEPEIKDRYDSVDQMINLLNIIKDEPLSKIVKKYCPGCGSPNEQGLRYCRKCGMKLF